MRRRRGFSALFLGFAMVGTGHAQDNAAEPPDPNRPLSADEAVQLVEQVTILLDEQLPWDNDRKDALHHLAYGLHHRAALPAMRRLLNDEELSPDYRVDCLDHMVTVGGPDGLDDVVRTLRDPVGHLRGYAWFLLTHLYPDGVQFGLDPTDSAEASEAAIERWEEWWKANRDTFEIPVWHRTWTE